MSGPVGVLEGLTVSTDVKTKIPKTGPSTRTKSHRRVSRLQTNPQHEFGEEA